MSNPFAELEPESFHFPSVTDPDTRLVLALLTARPLRSIEEVRRDVKAMQRQLKGVLREIREWKKRASIRFSTAPMDTRLRPFALALGRLLANDVLRHPVVQRKP